MPDLVKTYPAQGPTQGGAPVPPAQAEAVPVFDRRVPGRELSLLVDEILPSGVLLEFVAVDVLNCFINYVEIRGVITERDPEEDERHISMSNRFYTHFHEFGTVVHVIASSAKHWWYFCYDIDASDHAIGRVDLDRVTLQQVIAWVYRERATRRYPIVEIDVQNIQGWRSFQ